MELGIAIPMNAKQTNQILIHTSQMQSLETPDMDGVFLVVKVQLLAWLICESR